VFWVFLTYDGPAGFLDGQSGFFTYHGFLTITSSSRIISRDSDHAPYVPLKRVEISRTHVVAAAVEKAVGGARRRLHGP
jgi:hypothetical protein